MSAPAILLKRTLDERSPSRRFDARALQAEIDELERAVAPVRLITAVKRRGPLVEVQVLAASATRSPRRAAAAASRTLSTAGSVSAWRPDPW